MTAKKQSLLEKGVILHVSAHRNSPSAFLMQINIKFTHKLEKSGTFFFGVHLCLSFLFVSLMAYLSQNHQQQTDDSSFCICVLTVISLP